MNVAEFRPSELRTHHKNPRQGVVPAIMASLRAHGQYRPLVVNRGTHTGRVNEVLAGNHTLKAIRTLAEEYPSDDRWQNVQCWMLDVDDDEGDRIVAVDNRTSELGSFDDRLLLELLSGLPDLTGTGYDETDLAALEAMVNDDIEDQEPLTDPDTAPPIPSVPVTKLGDVWVLGNHRVVCGDSRDPAVVARVMDGSKAELVWTDPPYGVSYVGKTADALTIENDSLDPEELEQFLDEAFTTAVGVCEPGAVVYVAAPAGPLHNRFGAVLDRLGIWKQTIVWVKNSLVMGRSHFHYRHEPIFYGWVPGAACLHAPEERNNDTVWEVDRPTVSKEHPTMKPVALVQKALELSSRRGAVVFDPFGGSGTTLIAAQGCGRRACLVELDPKYVDVICKRFEQVSGIAPVLEWSARGETGLPDLLGS